MSPSRTLVLPCPVSFGLSGESRLQFDSQPRIAETRGAAVASITVDN